MATYPPSPPVELYSYPGLSAYATCLATSGGLTGLTLSGGYLYVIRPDHACHWKQGPSASGPESVVAASTSNDVLGAGQARYIWITQDSTSSVGCDNALS